MKRQWRTIAWFNIWILILLLTFTHISRYSGTPIIYEAQASQEIEPIKEEESKDKKYTDEKIENIIKDVFNEEPTIALAVARAESGLNPSAVNAKDTHKGCKGSYGLFQIGCIHEKNTEKLLNVEYNIKKAHEIYTTQGWKPWGAYTDGSYKKYIK